MTEKNGSASKERVKRENVASFAWLSFFLLSYVFLPAFILSVFLLLRVGSPALAYWSSLAVLSGLPSATFGGVQLIAGVKAENALLSAWEVSRA